MDQIRDFVIAYFGEEALDFFEQAIRLVREAQTLNPEGDAAQKRSAKWKYLWRGIREWAKGELRELPERAIDTISHLAIHSVKDEA